MIPGRGGLGLVAGGSGGVGFTNPLTDFVTPLYTGCWAEDPLWTNPGDGNAVSSWRNGGTLGTDPAESGSNRPLYRAANSVLNNMPCLEFDGTGQRLVVTSGVSLAQGYTIITISTFDTNTSRALAGINSTSVNRRFGASGLAVWVLQAGASPLASGGAPVVNTPYMNHVYVNGGSSAIYRNGTSVASGSAGADSLDQIIIGAARSAPSTYSAHFDGKLALWAIYPGDASTDASWPAFKTWCSRYGITVV